MFLSELHRVLLRRWYLVLLGAIATVGLGYQTTRMMPPDYTVTAETLMLPPATSVPAGSNPYLALGGLDAAGDVLSKSLSSDAAAAAVKAQGARGQYTVSLDPGTPAPLVLVTATASSSDDAMGTLQLVLNRLPVTLAEIQQSAKVPQNAMITSSVITKSTEAVKSSKPQVRALVVALGAGLGLTLLLVAAVDALMRGRRARRGQHTQPSPLAASAARSTRRRPRPVRPTVGADTPAPADGVGGAQCPTADVGSTTGSTTRAGDAALDQADHEPSAAERSTEPPLRTQRRRPTAADLSRTGR